MTTLRASEFKNAVQQLHRVKDEAYRDAWKRRGEVMSIMANIARKVDRLEYVTDGAPPTADESLLDTAVDLLVYSLKYQTHLADQDPAVAAALYPDDTPVPPYSDGKAGFDELLQRLDVTAVDRGTDLLTDQATQHVLTAFAELEVCFGGALAPVRHRGVKAATLTHATVVLIGSLIRKAPERYGDFLMTWREEIG
jgi:hypothetical protein